MALLLIPRLCSGGVARAGSRGSAAKIDTERERLAKERDATAAQMAQKEREIAEMEAAIGRRSAGSSRATSPEPVRPCLRAL